MMKLSAVFLLFPAVVWANKNNNDTLHGDDQAFWMRFLYDGSHSLPDADPLPPDTTNTPTSAPTLPPTFRPTAHPSVTPSALPSNQQCQVDVDIVCQTTDGLDCDLLQFPSCKAVDEMSFAYLPKLCGSYERCEDVRPRGFLDLLPSRINCWESRDEALGQTVEVQPAWAFPGAILTLRSSPDQQRPNTIECRITDLLGITLHQILTLDAQTLHVGDEYGSLVLKECGGLSCTAQVQYEYSLRNVGSAEMQVTKIDRSSNRGSPATSLLDRVTLNPLQPGEFTTVSETDVIDLCKAGTHTVDLTVEADPPDGDSCRQSKQSRFSVIPDCIVDLDMKCTLDGPNGPDCSELPGTLQPQCVCQTCVTDLVFRYTAADCGQDDPNRFYCIQGPQQSPSPNAEIVVAGATKTYYHGIVGVGDLIEIADSDCIENHLHVAVLDPVTGSLIQELVVSSSCSLGSEMLLLENTGSLQLVGYRCQDEEPQHCLADVTFDIRARNNGLVDLLVTDLELDKGQNVSRSFNGAPVPVPSGENVTFSISERVDFCQDASFQALAAVVGKTVGSSAVCEDVKIISLDRSFGTPYPTMTPTCLPSERPSSLPSGRPSELPTLLPSFAPTNSECKMEVDIECETASGANCKSLSYTTGSCTTDSTIEELVFQYIPGMCGNSHNQQGTLSQCTDISATRDGRAVLISCANEVTRMQVQPMVILPLGTFTLSNPLGALPNDIVCTIKTYDGQYLQSVTLNTSGDVNLFLGDVFGSLKVRSCTGSDLECTETLLYQYRLSNVGSAVMNVTMASRIFNGVNVSFLNDLPSSALENGETVSFAEQRITNLCVPGSYTTEVFVEAVPPNGGSCQGEISDSFSIMPDCNVGLSMSCGVDSSGSKCDELNGMVSTQCLCESCPQRLMFRYTGESCDSNAAVDGLINCSENALENTSGDVNIVVVSAGEVLFQDSVSLGDEFEVEGSSCIGGTLSVLVSNVLTGRVYQEITLSTSCVLGTEIVLMDSFGSLQFIAYQCLGEQSQDCFVDVTYSLRAVNTGDVSFSITDFRFDLNSGPESLLSGIALQDLTIDVGSFIFLERPITLELCSDQRFHATADVIGRTIGSNVVCMDKAETSTLFKQVAPLRILTAPPTKLPTGQPSVAPSASPTEACVLSMSADCVFANNNNAWDGQSCEVEMLMEPCLSRPTEAIMLYTGGDCSKSFNIQPFKFFCEDRNGGPPTSRGESSYIVVTDIKGKGIVYFEGLVPVGETYTLFDGGERFEADQLITIYESASKSSDGILQVVQYHSSCSQNLELKNSFGASQLVGFYNDVQGNVTCFATTDIVLNIRVPLEIGDEDVLLDLLTAETSFAGTFDLTDQVAGKMVTGDQAIVASFQAEIDLSDRQRYDVDATLLGSKSTSVRCSGDQQRFSFYAGNPALPGFPTTVPTREPTVSLRPTTDPKTTRCQVQASIVCSPQNGASSCDTLVVPDQATCQTSEGQPTKLRWLYNGLACSSSNTTAKDFKCRTENARPIGEQDALITVTDKREKTVYLSTLVSLGGMFTVEANEELDDTILISIAASDDTETVLQELQVPTSCQSSDDDLTLLKQYGGLQLIGYETAETGYHTGIERLDMVYLVSNLGDHSLNLTQALLKSDFLGEWDFVSKEGLRIVPGTLEMLRFSVQINLFESNGMSIGNNLALEATALENDLVCQDTATMDLMVVGP